LDSSQSLQAVAPITDYSFLLTVADVAKMLNMSCAWVRQHSSSGSCQPRIRCLKLGKSVRYRREWIVEFIDSLERAA
jgi:hypothetical protein